MRPDLKEIKENQQSSQMVRCISPQLLKVIETKSQKWKRREKDTIRTSQSQYIKAAKPKKRCFFIQKMIHPIKYPKKNRKK
jgi:hypothetical protein